MAASEPTVPLSGLIRELRLAVGYSPGRLAERLRELSGVAITREYVSRWECGKRTPSRYWLPHLATARAPDGVRPGCWARMAAQRRATR